VRQHDAQRVKVQRRDRPWVDAYVTVLVGPFAMPSTDALRGAVAALADRYPDSRLIWSLDPAKRYWRTDRTAESVVTERDWDDAVELGVRLDAMAADESLDPPLTLIRYPNAIGLRMSHGVGDGRLFLTVIAAVLHTAFAGEVIQWPVQSAGRFPLTAAAFGTFARHPTQIRSAIRDRFPRPPAEEPVTARPWAPSRRTVHTTMPRAQAEEFFVWGKEFAPSASRFALEVALVLSALKKVGMEISRDVRVLVDLRRYLGWRYIDGNFVAGVPMRIGPEMGPEEISSIIKATNVSGRPLAGQLLASVLGGVKMETATSVDSGARPILTFSNMGSSPPEIDSLPFLPDHPAVYAASVPPGGPLGVTVLTGSNAHVMSINVTFHDNVVDPLLLEEAIGLMEANPIGLLSDSSRSP
jgi:hypothetical protein